LIAHTEARRRRRRLNDGRVLVLNNPRVRRRRRRRGRFNVDRVLVLNDPPAGLSGGGVSRPPCPRGVSAGSHSWPNASACTSGIFKTDL